jgi:hypothetical protein
MHAIHHDLHDYIHKFMKTRKQEKLGEKYIVHGSLSCECSTTWILNVDTWIDRQKLERMTCVRAASISRRSLGPTLSKRGIPVASPLQLPPSPDATPVQVQPCS